MNKLINYEFLRTVSRTGD